MHAFCFFKTRALSQAFQTYLHKNFSSLVFSDKKEKSRFSSSFIILEDPTSQELETYKNFYGICLYSKPDLISPTKEFPHLIFLQKPIYLPFLVQIFIEQAQKLILLTTSNTHESIKIGPFHYKKLQRRLLDVSQHKTISLTEKEAALLDFLSLRSDGYATRAELLENIWKFRNDISTRTLESHIYTLRKKIEPNPNSPEYLLTKEGGYCLKYESV